MLPDPLHPAVVHFPIVLAVLLPLIAAASLWSIGRGASARRAWAVASIAFAAVAASAFAATRTGEQQEDRVERVVPEQALESHEEAGERFQLVALGGLALALIGFAPGTLGTVGRVAATLGSVVLLAMSWNVGGTGGELVYRHNAASAYADPSARGAPAAPRGKEDDDEDVGARARAESTAVAQRASRAPNGGR